MVKLRQEPLVDVGHLPDLIDAVPAMERGRDGEYALVCGVDKLFVDVFNIIVLKTG